MGFDPTLELVVELECNDDVITEKLRTYIERDLCEMEERVDKNDENYYYFQLNPSSDEFLDEVIYTRAIDDIPLDETSQDKVYLWCTLAIGYGTNIDIFTKDDVREALGPFLDKLIINVSPHIKCSPYLTIGVSY